MGVSEEVIRKIARDCALYLCTVEDGEEYTSAEILKGYGCDEDTDPMIFNRFLHEECGKLGVELECARPYEVIGLPYVIPFYVRNKEARLRCPYCGSIHVGEYLYGLPAFSEELEKEIEEGKVILKGCLVSGNDPGYHCHDCGKDFGKRIW